jgi:hypothetical protein
VDHWRTLDDSEVRDVLDLCLRKQKNGEQESVCFTGKLEWLISAFLKNGSVYLNR